jgi:hypothetical protein
MRRSAIMRDMSNVNINRIRFENMPAVGKVSYEELREDGTYARQYTLEHEEAVSRMAALINTGSEIIGGDNGDLWSLTFSLPKQLEPSSTPLDINYYSQVRVQTLQPLGTETYIAIRYVFMQPDCTTFEELSGITSLGDAVYAAENWLYSHPYDYVFVAQIVREGLSVCATCKSLVGEVSPGVTQYCECDG